MALTQQEVVVLLDSSDDEEAELLQAAARRASGRAAGPSQPRQTGVRRRQPTGNQSRQQEQADFIDLTNTPDSPRVEMVSSTVEPVRLKRPRLSKADALQALVAAARNPPPPPPPEPAGIKCGICLEVMGGSSNRAMASGPCGHVYCRECLTEAVRTQKKCPSCRKNLQLRQLHQVFVEFGH